MSGVGARKRESIFQSIAGGKTNGRGRGDKNVGAVVPYVIRGFGYRTWPCIDAIGQLGKEKLCR